MKPSILVIAREESALARIGALCRDAGYAVAAAATGALGLAAYARGPTGLVVLDLHLPDMPGSDLLDGLRAADPDVVVVALAAADRVDEALDVAAAGAESLLVLPVDPRHMRLAIDRAREKAELRRAAVEARIALAATEAEQGSMIGAMRDLVLVLDGDGTYVKVPPAAPDLLYQPGEQLLGRRMHDIMPADAADVFLATVQRALAAGDAVRIEYSLPIGDRTVWFSAVVSPLSADRVVWVARDVTAQHEAEEALRLSEERYRLLFEVNPLPMWVYDRATLRFLAVNEAAEAQYGYTRQEFLAMTLEDIRPQADVEKLRQNVEGSPSGLHRTEGWRHRRRDGTIIDVEIVAHGLEFDGRAAELVLALDQTRRRQAEGMLRETLSVLRAVVDDSPLAIISVSLGFEVTRWNPAAERLLGWTAAERIGRPFHDLVPREARPEIAQLRSALRAGRSVTDVETRRMRKDGSLVDVSLSIAALHDEGGAVNGYIVVLADVTERKRLEARVRQAQKMEAVGQLAGGVAHDFNNLLTAITSYSQLLLESIAPGDARHEDVVQIQRAADSAAALTRQLLAFSRQQIVLPQVLSLNAVIAEIEKMLERLVREDIELRVALDPALGWIKADRAQVQQIVMNLVVNAQDALPGGGTITIETANAEVTAEDAGKHAETAVVPGPYALLSVSDTGVGIPPELQGRIFEPFFTTKEAGRGTGLGLATVYGIVKQARGYVWLQSEPGQGTTFKVYLPRTDAALVPAAGTVLRRASGGSAEKVLLVEDDDAVRSVARRILTRQSYVVVEARSGTEALSVLEQMGDEIDLLVTDIVMPEMSGADVARRARERHSGLPVLFMSGYSRDAGEWMSAFTTRSAYLEKPFTPDALTSKVRQLLDSR